MVKDVGRMSDPDEVVIDFGRGVRFTKSSAITCGENAKSIIARRRGSRLFLIYIVGFNYFVVPFFILR